MIGENRDESKAGSYTLPDMMRLASGSAVRTVADWEQRRRPELLDLFRSEIYGYAHPRPPAHIQDRRSDPQAMGGKASFKKVAISFRLNGDPFTFHVMLFIPNQRRGRVPAFLTLNDRPVTPIPRARSNPKTGPPNT